MYQTISQIPKEELEKIRKTGKNCKLILYDACPEDFKKVVCRDGKKPFTKENLILEISKIKLFPDYTLILDVNGNIHLVPYGKEISDTQMEEMYNIFRNIFGIVEYE